MRLSVESTTFDNKLNICQFIVKSRVDPGKIRASDLNLLVLEAYLELSDGIGTKLKLCF